MIISRTPLRVSFVGGGTDMKYFYSKVPGSVISTSINKYIYIIVKKRVDNKIVLNYSKRESVDKVEDIKHDLIKACLSYVNIESSIEITSIADIPSEGSGLGSSSSFTVGLLNALFGHLGKRVDQEELARLACKIEIDICKAPIGKQDQYGASVGGLKKIYFNQDNSVIVEKISDINGLYRKLNNKMILVNSDIYRSASKILKVQKENSDLNMPKLINIASMVDNFENYLKEQNFDLMYRQLDIYWHEKKSLVQSQVKKDLEIIYDYYVPEFCSSGKICGAGGGGYFIFFKKDNVKLSQKKYIEVEIDIEGSIIIYNN